MLLTTGEKERIFMDAIQSFYYNQRQMLDDDDFDKLKEDLAWEGSKVRSFHRCVWRYGRGRTRHSSISRLIGSLVGWLGG